MPLWTTLPFLCHNGNADKVLFLSDWCVDLALLNSESPGDVIPESRREVNSTALAAMEVVRNGVCIISSL